MRKSQFEDLDRRPVAAASQLQSVPIIDISRLMVEDDSEAISQIASAASTWGFFQVVGHGLSDVLTASVIEQAQTFFALRPAKKNTVRRSRNNPWGYNDNELTKNQRDKKAVFDFTLEGVDAIYHARNQWPSGMPAFRAVMLKYLEVCTTISLRLVDAFSMGAGLPAEALRQLFEPVHTGFIRLNYYPMDDPRDVVDEEPDEAKDQGADLASQELGIHHHTDAGALTLLLQDQVSGLQVFKDNLWHDVAAEPQALVVNTGDMMQVLSNDYYQAPIHRVRAMTQQARYSIPFFLNMSASASVEPAQTLVSENRPARYRPIPWTEFRRRRSDGDYADYGSEVQIADYKKTGS